MCRSPESRFTPSQSSPSSIEPRGGAGAVVLFCVAFDGIVLTDAVTPATTTENSFQPFHSPITTSLSVFTVSSSWRAVIGIDKTSTRAKSNRCRIGRLFLAGLGRGGGREMGRSGQSGVMAMVPTHCQLRAAACEWAGGQRMCMVQEPTRCLISNTVKKIRKFTTIHWRICFRLAVVNLQQNVVSSSTSP